MIEGGGEATLEGAGEGGVEGEELVFFVVLFVDGVDVVGVGGPDVHVFDPIIQIIRLHYY